MFTILLIGYMIPAIIVLSSIAESIRLYKEGTIEMDHSDFYDEMVRRLVIAVSPYSNIVYSYNLFKILYKDR